MDDKYYYDTENLVRKFANFHQDYLIDKCKFLISQLKEISVTQEMKISLIDIQLQALKHSLEKLFPRFKNKSAAFFCYEQLISDYDKFPPQKVLEFFGCQDKLKYSINGIPTTNRCYIEIQLSSQSLSSIHNKLLDIQCSLSAEVRYVRECNKLMRELQRSVFSPLGIYYITLDLERDNRDEIAKHAHAIKLSYKCPKSEFGNVSPLAKILEVIGCSAASKFTITRYSTVNTVTVILPLTALEIILKKLQSLKVSFVAGTSLNLSVPVPSLRDDGSTARPFANIARCLSFHFPNMQDRTRQGDSKAPDDKASQMKTEDDKATSVTKKPFRPG